MKSFEKLLKKVSLILVTLTVSLFFPLVSGCQKTSTSTGPNTSQNEPQTLSKPDWQQGFPDHWWKPIPRDQAKSWEILPQDAGFNEVVLSKRNELGLLSNFSETPFVFHGVCYPNIEAFWQMMKYPETPDDERWSWVPNWKFNRAQVAQFNGYAAKSAGNYANFWMEKNNANWVTFEGKKLVFSSKTSGEHYQLIYNAIVEKLRQNPRVVEVLLSTKQLNLIPDHQISNQAPKEWHYNLLYMELRDLIVKNKIMLNTQEDLNLRTCHGLDNRN